MDGTNQFGGLDCDCQSIFKIEFWLWIACDCQLGFSIKIQIQKYTFFHETFHETFFFKSKANPVK
jgi:hypothetical protein